METTQDTVAEPTPEEQERAKRRALHELFNKVLNRHENKKPYHERTARDFQLAERLRCMYDLAQLLGGESERTFERCLQTLDRFEADLHPETCAFSLCWEGRGMYGGFIFHTSCKEWSIHT